MGKFAKTKRVIRFFAGVAVVSAITTSLAGCQRTTPPSPEAAKANKQILGKIIDRAVDAGLGSAANWKIMKTCSGSGGCYEDNHYYASFSASKTGVVFADRREFCEAAFEFAAYLQPEVVGQMAEDTEVKDLESGLKTCLDSPNQSFQMWTTRASYQLAHRWELHINSTAGDESIQFFLF
jgi:hypothetical protein